MQGTGQKGRGTDVVLSSTVQPAVSRGTQSCHLAAAGTGSCPVGTGRARMEQGQGRAPGTGSIPRAGRRSLSRPFLK